MKTKPNGINPDELPRPHEPYRGILPFRLLDWRIFLEREVETERLSNLVAMCRGVLLYGQSGAGKSSLLNAGLVPEALRRGCAPERIRVFPEPGRELVVERIRLLEEGQPYNEERALPCFLPSRFAATDTNERVALSCPQFYDQLHAESGLGVPLLIFDQFEELVTLFEENPRDTERFQAARAAREAIESLLCKLLRTDPFPLRIVFAFRDDYLARLTPLFARFPNLTDQGVRLALPPVDRVKPIVRGPFVPSADGVRGLPKHFRGELDEELADKIAAGIQASRPSGLLNLSELQTLCLALWRQPAHRAQLFCATDPAVVLRQIIESEAVAGLRKLRYLDQVRALALLSNLVTVQGTRDVVSEEKLAAETSRHPLMRILRGHWPKVLGKLQEKTGLVRRSVSSGTPYYELASEFLIPWIQKRQRRFRVMAVVWGYVLITFVLLFVMVGLLALQSRSERDQLAIQMKRALAAENLAKIAQERAETAARQESEARINAEFRRTEAMVARDEAEKARRDAEMNMQEMRKSNQNHQDDVGKTISNSERIKEAAKGAKEAIEQCSKAVQRLRGYLTPSQAGHAVALSDAIMVLQTNLDQIGAQVLPALSAAKEDANVPIGDRPPIDPISEPEIWLPAVINAWVKPNDLLGHRYYLKLGTNDLFLWPNRVLPDSVDFVVTATPQGPGVRPVVVATNMAPKQELRFRFPSDAARTNMLIKLEGIRVAGSVQTRAAFFSMYQLK